MINHIWTILCSRSIVDQETQNISLLDVLEQVTIPYQLFSQGKGLVLPINFEVVTFWGRQHPKMAHQGTARLLLQSPSGQILNEHQYLVDLSQYERTRTRARVSSLMIHEPGRHIFIVEFKKNEREWTRVAEVPLQVTLAP